MTIALAIAVLGVLAIVFGLILAFAAKIFEVEVDPRLPQIQAALAGANCGGCGYPGCAGCAEAMLAGKAPVTACAPAGAEGAAKIAAILGMEAPTGEKMVAHVMCNGGCNAQKNFEDIEKKYNVGKASEFEFLRAKVNMNNAEPEVFSAENAVILAIWQLKAIMGIDLSTELDVEGKLSDYTEELLASALTANDTVSFDNNTNLIQLRIQDEMLSKTIKMTKFQYIPTLSAQFAYNYNAMGNTFDMNWNPYSVVALSLNIPIFDGFSKRNNIRQYKKTQDILRLNIEDAERNLNIALENYRDKMNTSVKRYTAAESTLEMAQKSYNISEKMYELGKATLVELNDAQLALTQAQLTMSQAIYQFMTNKAAIDELMGVEYIIEEENNSDNQ